MMGSFCYLCCGSSFVSPHLLCGGLILGLRISPLVPPFLAHYFLTI